MTKNTHWAWSYKNTSCKEKWDNQHSFKQSILKKQSSVLACNLQRCNIHNIVSKYNAINCTDVPCRAVLIQGLIFNKENKT